MLFFLNFKEHSGFFKKRIAFTILLCSFLYLSFSPVHLQSQISAGGQPASFAYPELRSITSLLLPGPDVEILRNEDIEDEKHGFPRRVGIAVRANLDMIRDGSKDILPGGMQVWRISLDCRDALALGLYFDDFHLPDHCRMFVYDESRQFILGAYTLYNNKQNRIFSTGLVPGDRITIEINVDPGITDLPICKISEVSYVYRDLPVFLKNRGTSDDCEVNINCPEGDNWQYQKHGVARIYVKQNSGFFWCTGSLVNNTLQNNEPYLLTADHCGPAATTEDIAQWVFYFNYEAPGCENPTVDPIPDSMTGATKLANAGTSGSDFLLLRLNDEVPLQYEPYYNGWSIENVPSPNGVTIHHPAGDIKKISTYVQPLQSSQWYGVPGTHWQVYWSQTITNWGVTEGGSSGAPLYDNTGRIVGTLTGGQAACDPSGSGAGTGPDQPDYYGKFSFSWDQNGSEPSQQLKYWLDPLNSGVISLPGKYADLTAAFEASETLILTGNSIEFTNLSSGLPVSYNWVFEGGEPGSYQGPGPIDVTYPETGRYDVSLIVSDAIKSDTLLLKDYIYVVGRVYPNPASDVVNIFLDEQLPALIAVEMFNIIGQKVYEQNLPEQSQQLISVDVSSLSIGAYTIRITANQRFLFARVLINR